MLELSARNNKQEEHTLEHPGSGSGRQVASAQKVLDRHRYAVQRSFTRDGICGESI